jgi:TIGR03009 family protein
MRPLGLTLAALVLAGPTLLAQSPGSPAKPVSAAGEPVLPAAPVLNAANQKALDYFLKLWEDRMSKITVLDAKVAMTEVTTDNGKEDRRVLTGDAQLMKPNYARLFLKDPQNPANAKRLRHIVADGVKFWDYQYARKVVGVQMLPENGIDNNTLMMFLFGMKADDIKKRYHLAVDVEDAKKYTEHYIHITILPKTRADLQEFKKAELILWKNNKDAKFADLWMLPARLWFQQTNGDQIIWQFDQMTTQKKLTAEHFKAPGFPSGDKDWKSEWITPPKPEVVRPVSGVGVPKK